MGIGKNREL